MRDLLLVLALVLSSCSDEKSSSAPVTQNIPTIPVAPADMARNAHTIQQAFDDQLAKAANRMRDNKMSTNGVSTVLAGMRSVQRQQLNILEETSAMSQTLRRAADAEPFDPAAFQAALKRYLDIQMAARDSTINRQIAIFRSLSPQDQRIFAQLMYSPRLSQSSRTPAGPIQPTR